MLKQTQNGKTRTTNNNERKYNNNKWIYYYRNGQLVKEGKLKYGEQDGKWTTYYENGKKWEEGNYKGGEYYIINGWNEDGELLIKDGNGKWFGS